MFKRFNPCQPCCSNTCYLHVYPAFPADGIESNFYYSLNVDYGEEYYNPIADETLTRQTPNFDLLIVRTLNNRTPSYGYEELIEFLNRGKSICFVTDYIGPPGLYTGVDYESAAIALEAMGMEDLSITPRTLSYFPYVGYYYNLAYGTNNISDGEEWEYTHIAGASTVSGGITISASEYGDTLVGVNYGSNGGKFFLSGDGNFEGDRLNRTLCNLKGQTIH